jgi:hypothetical protein
VLFPGGLKLHGRGFTLEQSLAVRFCVSALKNEAETAVVVRVLRQFQLRGIYGFGQKQTFYDPTVDKLAVIITINSLIFHVHFFQWDGS